MLLCLNCYKIYNQKTIKNNMCKVKNCHGDIVEVDELFTPVIAELNRKGYKTRTCCSGHFDNNAYNAYNSYIYFEDNILLPSLPDGYMYDQDLYPWVDWEGQEKNIIRIQFDDKNKSFNELSKDIFMNAIGVLEWAEELEEFGGVKVKKMKEMEE